MGTQVQGRAAGDATLGPAVATPTAVPPAQQRTSTRINVTPSPRAVVNSGDFSYFSDKGISPLPYALSEFVDNSLSAINARMTADSGKSLAPNIIPGDIRISFDKSDKVTTVIIWDNGCGMNLETLKNFAIYALSPEDRLARLNAIPEKSGQQAFLSEFYSNPLRINTNISMFGVGAKMSAYFIGQDLTMVTKCSEFENVLEFRCNSSEMISEFHDRGINCYDKSIIHRAPGAVADSELFIEAAAIARLKNYIEVMEKQHKSFTYAVISGVKKDFITRFEKFHRETAFSLADVYHWYLHGHPTMKTTIGGNVSMSLSVGSMPILDMKAIPSVVKEQIARKKDTFSFEIVDASNEVAVFGFINYFPFDDAETCPKESNILAHWNGSAEPESDDEDDEVDATSASDPAQQSISPIFSCWWQGRLIPMTTVESLKWMGSSFKATTSRCRHRVKGCLFFDRIFKVTQNKSTFTEDLRYILERPGAVVQLVDNSRGPTSKLPRSNKSVEDAFKEWIKSCHDRYDKEVQLRKKFPKEDHERWRAWLEYKEMVITGKEVTLQHEFKVNDIIRINTQSAKRPRFGRIVKFFRTNPSAADDFESHPDFTFVSGSDRGLKCQIRALPEFCYPNPKDQLVFVKLRMIDKATSKDDVVRQLDALAKQQVKHIPQRLGFHIYEPGYIPGRVSAGYKFPNVDIQIFSGTGEPLTRIPFENTKSLKSRQRFYIKKQGKFEELRCFDGVAKEKVFSFWEIDTLFKNCGFYSCVFDIPNYTSPLEDAILTKTYEFQVVPGPPTAVTISKSSANPLTITLGAPSTGELSVQFTDQFKNACMPDEIFLNNLVLSHEYLIVKPKPFKVVNGKVVIANIYTEPKSAGDGFVKFNPNEILFLDIGLKGRPDAIGAIPVKLSLGQPCNMAWVTEDNRPFRVTSGGKLSSLKVQLVDRYGLPAKPNSTVKSLSLKLLDSNSRLNGVAGRPVPVPDLSDPSGLIPIPVVQINSGLERVTLRASLLVKKTNVTGRTIELDRDIIVQPGNMLGQVKLTIANEMDEIPSVVVGSKHSLQIDLFGENGQAWQKPYSEQICKRYQFQYNGESFPLTPLGVIPNVVTFPQQIFQNPFKVCATIMELSEETVNIPFQCHTQVTLLPDVGVEWKAIIMRPIRCGEPIGDAIQIRFLDRFGNFCIIDPNAGTIVSFGGQHGQPSIQGSQMASFDASKTCLTYPGIILVGHGPGYIVFVNRQPLAKFEIIEGPPCSLVLHLSDDLRNFQQTLSENVTNIDVPIISRSKRDFDVYALDAAGSVVSYPPNIQIACKDAVITSKVAPHPYKKSFKLMFNVPVRQQTVTVAITCDRIPKPMVCAFPVQPWLQGISEINMEPTPPVVTAGAPFPVIAGHILDGAGNPVLLHQNPHLLSSLSLVFSNNDNGRDLTKDLFAPAAFRDMDGAFAFIARDAITMAGTYSISVIYTERRREILEILGHDQEGLRSTKLTLRINPGPAARLYIDAPNSKEPSFAGRPIPKLLKISVQDDFGNPVLHRFSQRDAENLKLKLKIGHEDIAHEHLTRPAMSIDSFGNIIVESLVPNPQTPLKDGTYTLRFRVVTCPHLQPCSLEFFYSSNVQAVSEFRELSALEENLNAVLSSLRQDLCETNEAASVLTDRLNNCRDSCRAIVSRLFSVGQEVDIVKDLNHSTSRFNTLRAEIARATRPAAVGAGIHQRLQNMREFIGIMGLLGNCSNDEDCRLVSYALGGKISAAVFHTISADDSRKLNMKHFALDIMSKSDPPSLARCRSLFNQYGRQWNTDPIPLLELFHPDPNISKELFNEVFVGLLGKILVCRTYDDAMAFKRFCSKHRIPCGNILTYDGRIVAASGELGGTIPEFTVMPCRVGVEPRRLREQLIAFEKRIQDLEQHQRLVAEERQLCEQQNTSSDQINSIEQRINETERELKVIRTRIEATDPNGSSTRRRRRASAGPTARGDGPAARRRRMQ